jgi:sarcosine oxidase subunit alpha
MTPDRSIPGQAQRYRIASGGAIDRAAPLGFTFNGTRYEGYRGDTLASALLANGVHFVARSFKYHRPRGIVSAGPEEPCALVRVGEGARAKPNLPAPLVELHDGLTAASINCWPSVGLDFGAVINLCAGWFPAGFYYKTFMWPASAWMTYERFIRRAAGLGVAPDAPDPDRYEKRFEHCDVLVVGGGPAGIAAALAAGEAGARVLLVEERPALGGQALFRDEPIEGREPHAWLDQSARALGALPEVRVVTRATATGYYDHNFVTVVERVADHVPQPARCPPRQRLWKIFAKEVVIASGAIERPLVFDCNDLPGVMLAGAAQRYARQYAVKPGSRAVVFTNNDSGYEAAAALAQAGVEVAAVVDPRAESPAIAPARAQSIRVMTGHAVVRAHGRRRVSGVSVATVDERGHASGGLHAIACDLVCVAGGWDPAVHLYSQSGGRLAFDDAQQCFVPGSPAQPTRAAGAANGAFGVGDCISQGRAAGTAGAAACGFGTPQAPAPAPARLALHPLWAVRRASRGGKPFVDLQHDVTVQDLDMAAREGYVSVEHAKRYTTTGMGVDQGKTGNIIAFGLLGQATDRVIPQVGTTTFRPPYTPVPIGTLAGREIGERLDPVRRTPITDWHEAAGAVFEPVGLWRRPLYYPRRGEDMHAAVARECAAARTGVALLDASTLGKIEVQGHDALTLLNRVYANAWDGLKVGRCRYGLMLGEDGMVLDDGVTARLGEHHYLISTTSGGADRVYGWLEDWLQCEWPGVDVYLTPLTAQWANLCVTGPKAREVIGTISTDIDFSPAAFPHMSMRTGTFGGAPARVMRVSFTGEVSYEINVPARHGRALWDALCAAGAAHGITPLGTEALHVLRAEKGYIAVGHETDGTVNPFDLGLERLVNMKKGDFLGKRGLARADNVRPGRKQLVGLLTDDAWRVVNEGSQIVTDAHAHRIDRPPVPMTGHVTSSYMSAALGRSIALALVENGRRRIGERVHAVVRGRAFAARIVPPVFFDAEGTRLHG